MEEKDKIALVGPAADKRFWRLEAVLAGWRAQALRVQSVSDQVLADLQGFQPQAVFVSTSVLDQDLAKAIAGIKDATQAEVVAVASQTDKEREFAARKAGIFCFLVMPHEEGAANVVVQAVLQKRMIGDNCRKSDQMINASEEGKTCQAKELAAPQSRPRQKPPWPGTRAST